MRRFGAAAWSLSTASTHPLPTTPLRVKSNSVKCTNKGTATCLALASASLIFAP